MNRTTFAVIGVHGYGRIHLADLARLAADGRAEVVAVADPRGAEGAVNVPDGVPCFPDLQALLADVVPDVVVIATPIHTHAPLAIAAMRAGAHVLLEKPTAASLAELEELLAVSRETGRSVQVGFQSFGSLALPEIERLIADGVIGDVRSIGGVGTWLRTVGYYRRSRWAGMRSLDGIPVVDGVTTNPLAHAVATGLRIAGCRRAEDVASVELELYHAHDIEADDTSSIRVTGANGASLAFGLTLCAGEQASPVLTVHGTTGSIELEYTNDVLRVRTADGVTEQQLGRVGVLANLLDHLTDGTPLVSPAEESGAFMRVLEAVRTAPDPTPIDPTYVQWLGEGDDRHPVVQDVESWCARVATEQQLFSEVGAPWARSLS